MFILRPRHFLIARTSLLNTRSLGTSNVGEIVNEFRKQAHGFENKWSARYLSSSEHIMKWIIDTISPCLKPGSKVLDVAAGTAIFSRALAPLCSSVTAVDITPEMLQEGERLAKIEGHSNIEFSVEDAAELPFPDNSFDLVVCRLAIHHFPEPGKQVREMVRVCRKHGHIVLVDLTAHEDAVLARMQNTLERLRDPSHATALTVREIEDLLLDNGTIQLVPEEALSGSVISNHGRLPRSILQNRLTLEGWLESTNTPPENRVTIQEIVDEEILTETDLTGMGCFNHTDDEGNKIICFHHNWVVVTGQKL